MAGAFLAAAAATAQAPQSCPANQAVCQVQSGQTLNLVINGDTTATGDRVRQDRIYELQRNSLYLMNADVRNNGYHLRIYGAEGTTGSIPQVYTVLNPDTGERVGDPFGMEGNITFRNFAMAGVLPASAGGSLANISIRVIRVRAPGFDLVMDGFHAINFQASIVRAQSALRKFEMTNSLWANSGWLGDNGTNFGAGKGIDLRDGSIDELIMRNNTFVNFTDRIIRHRNSTGAIGSMVFDHNTIINTISYHGMLALGEVGESIQITNNLFLDGFAAGADSSDIVRQEEFNESGEVYASNGQPKMSWISSVPNQTTTWTVNNNVYAVSDAMEAFYQQFGDGGGDDGNPDNGTDGDNDIIDEGDPLTDHIRSRVANASAAFQEVDLTLANAPTAPVGMLTWYRTETGRTKETITFDASTDDYDRRTVAYFLGDFDPSYSTSSPAYTAAAGNCPAGNLNAFPSRFDACDGIIVANEGGPAGRAFALSSAPNPLQSSTTFTYTLAEASDVALVVYDALGRRVATLASGFQPDGTHTARWDAASAAPGLYVVRLRAGVATATQRVLVAR